MLHFLSGATLLLINYLVVNFSVMRKCAINQKAAKEKRRNGIRKKKKKKRPANAAASAGIPVCVTGVGTLRAFAGKLIDWLRRQTARRTDNGAD